MLEILAKYALWSVGTGRPEALDDALALRMAAIEAAEVVFRVCHQLHGAVGFCDETTLSWLSRYSQPLRRLAAGLSATRDMLTRRVGTHRARRALVRPCGSRDRARRVPRTRAGVVRRARPADWRAAQTGVSDAEFVAFQKAWFAELHARGLRRAALAPRMGRRHVGRRADRAVPGTGRARRTAAGAGVRRDPPRRVDAAGRGHRRAARDGTCPRSSTARSGSRASPNPRPGSDLASLRTTARRDGDAYVVNGQKLWASGGMHADWCLLLARTDPEAPKRKGISYFLMDMTTPGIDVRPIRNAIGDSHFCEIFLNDVVIPAANLVGAENAGWQVAQATLGAERGMTMLELAERLGNAGFRWLVEALLRPTTPIVADRLAQFETEITGLRGLCRKVVEGHDTGTAGPADASIVKLYYSEVLQRMTDFGAEIGGLPAHTVLVKPMSSGWESGAWMLDFIGSWEWTIPGGSSEIQRTIIAERGLGLPREPSAV